MEGSEQGRVGWAERKTIEAFRERAHQYLPQAIEFSHHFEWLAAMQHYGAPTRLLDFTRSSYIAAFFALEHATAPDGRCAVFVVDARWCDQRARILINETWAPSAPAGLHDGLAGQVPLLTRQDTFNDLIFSNKTAMVIPLEVRWPHERLVMQQGLFVCPGDVNVPFIENLEAMYAPGRYGVFKLVMPNAIRTEALLDLHRMNVSRAALFPGLDGVGQFVHHRLLIDGLLADIDL